MPRKSLDQQFLSSLKWESTIELLKQSKTPSPKRQLPAPRRSATGPNNHHLLLSQLAHNEHLKFSQRHQPYQSGYTQKLPYAKLQDLLELALRQWSTNSLEKTAQSESAAEPWPEATKRFPIYSVGIALAAVGTPAPL